MNAGMRFMFGGYTLERAGLKPMLSAILSYFALELREGWKSWFSAEELPQNMPKDMPFPAQEARAKHSSAPVLP
jgi:hypothetical protein